MLHAIGSYKKKKDKLDIMLDFAETKNQKPNDSTLYQKGN